MRYVPAFGSLSAGAMLVRCYVGEGVFVCVCVCEGVCVCVCVGECGRVGRGVVIIVFFTSFFFVGIIPTLYLQQ